MCTAKYAFMKICDEIEDRSAMIVCNNTQPNETNCIETTTSNKTHARHPSNNKNNNENDMKF